MKKGIVLGIIISCMFSVYSIKKRPDLRDDFPLKPKKIQKKRRATRSLSEGSSPGVFWPVPGITLAMLSLRKKAESPQIPVGNDCSNENELLPCFEDQSEAPINPSNSPGSPDDKEEDEIMLSFLMGGLLRDGEASEDLTDWF